MDFMLKVFDWRERAVLGYTIFIVTWKTPGNESRRSLPSEV
jgi:hypothetical protein